MTFVWPRPLHFTTFNDHDPETNAPSAAKCVTDGQEMYLVQPRSRSLVEGFISPEQGLGLVKGKGKFTLRLGTLVFRNLIIYGFTEVIRIVLSAAPLKKYS